jgi:hypothetical protein
VIRLDQLHAGGAHVALIAGGARPVRLRQVLAGQRRRAFDVADQRRPGLHLAQVVHGQVAHLEAGQQREVPVRVDVGIAALEHAAQQSLGVRLQVAVFGAAQRRPRAHTVAGLGTLREGIAHPGHLVADGRAGSLPETVRGRRAYGRVVAVGSPVLDHVPIPLVQRPVADQPLFIPGQAGVHVVLDLFRGAGGVPQAQLGQAWSGRGRTTPLHRGHRSEDVGVSPIAGATHLQPGAA